jgi:hypothetical protein
MTTPPAPQACHFPPEEARAGMTHLSFCGLIYCLETGKVDWSVMKEGE